jgi:hypothetical protein
MKTGTPPRSSAGAPRRPGLKTRRSVGARPSRRRFSGDDRNLPAFCGELALAWDAAREHRLTPERGRGRIRRCGNSNAGLARLALPAILTAAACRYTAGMSCTLTSSLLGVHHTTTGDASRQRTSR